MMSKNFKETLCKNRKMEPFHTGYAFKDGLCASCYIEQQAEQIARLKENYIKGQLYTVRQLIGQLKYREQDIVQMLQAAKPQKGINDE